MKRMLENKNKFYRMLLAAFTFVVLTFSVAVPVFAASNTTGSSTTNSGPHCGGGNGYTPVYTSIDLGCTGRGNPIVDLMFAIIRLLGAGVGIVIIASVIIAGIQFSTSHDDPQAKAASMKRIQSSVTALFIYIFAYAILNFVLPGGFFNS